MANKNTRPPIESKESLPQSLLWLFDAPLFIDDINVGRFYDAVARPEAQPGKTTVAISKQQIQKIAGELGLSGEIGLGTLTQFLSYFVNPKVSAAAKGSAERSSQKGETHTIELNPISNPERQLVQLTLHYILNQRNRLFLIEKPASEEWREPDTIQRVPRALAFLNLPGASEAHHFGLPETKIIPTAAEFEDGKIELIYEKLVNKEGEKAPPYPERALNPKELQTQRQGYWQWFDKNFSATKAMIAVEEAASTHGRIRWIDYRVPVTAQGDTLHLHVCPAGKYDTGVFAYNFIKRGYKHGLRLVGTLKSEPDMNVLAIYEK